MQRVTIERRLLRRDLKRGQLACIKDWLVDFAGIKPFAYQLERRAKWRADNNLHRLWE
jgi:hypothetical protein